MLLINNQEVEKLFTMKDCLAALEDGYDDLLKGDAVYRPRLDLWMPCDRPDGYYRWGTMEGASRKIGVFAIRMKSDIVYETENKGIVTATRNCVDGFQIDLVNRIGVEVEDKISGREGMTRLGNTVEIEHILSVSTG